MVQKLIFTHNVDGTIDNLCHNGNFDRYFVLCDTNTAQKVVPLMESSFIKRAHIITIPAGDEHKNIDTATRVWQELSNHGATRHSLLINIGGGMITDLGGFVATTFKRGMTFFNLPTTLLGAVDAACGGKTGVNLGVLKNEIGAFALAQAVIISTQFFATLPRQALLSGYAEMLKHGLIAGEKTYNSLLNYDITTYTYDTLLPLLRASIGIKQSIVSKDMHEQALRKSLNLGHTIGHALESHALHHNKPIEHGYAVAWGLVCEVILSHRLLKLPSSVVYELAQYVSEHYGAYHITCDDYDELIAYMQHDKKNDSNNIRFTLLQHLGHCQVNVPVDSKEIAIALDFYRDLFHL